jgi:hypothetical protein
MSEYRAKRDTVRPCQVCGWAQHMAIHSIIKDGKNAGRPFDHAYVPPEPKPPAPSSAQQGEGK